MPGHRTSLCDVCGDGEIPVILLYVEGQAAASPHVCLQCIARAVDSVTGWRMEALMIQMLSVSDVVARFRDPSKLRVAKPNAKDRNRRNAP